MNPETIRQIQESLAPLAEKLGQGAEFVYAAYYRQAIIDGILLLAIPLFFAVVLLFASVKFWRYATAEVKSGEEAYQRAKEAANGGYVSRLDYEGDLEFVRWWIVGVPWVFVVIALAVCLPSGISHLANPHYHAIQSLLSTIRGSGD